MAQQGRSPKASPLHKQVFKKRVFAVCYSSFNVTETGVEEAFTSDVFMLM